MIAAIWLRAPARARLHALRELYRRFFGENTPDARGRRLLAEWLSPEQRAQFEQHRYFDVIGCDTGKRYRIHYGTRLLSLRLAELGIEHKYEEFDDNHSDIDYRMDTSLPFLVRALA